MADTWPKKPQHLILTLDRHFGLFFTWPLVVPGFAWHFGVAKEGWSKNVGVDKWNEDVLADGVPIASLGNKPEMCLVPHWNLYPFPPWHPNLLIPVLILASSSESYIAVGSVVAKKGPIAVSLPFVKVIGNNLACNDPITMPTDVVIMPSSTVVLGFTLGDLIAAMLRYGLKVLIELILQKLTKLVGKGAKSLKKRLGERLGKSGNRFAQWASRKLLPATASKKAIGPFKRRALDWMNKMGINSRYHNPKMGSFDSFFGFRGDKVAGRFGSVFDDVAGRYQKEFGKQVFKHTGIPTNGEQLSDFIFKETGLPVAPTHVAESLGVPTSVNDAYKALEKQLVPTGEGIVNNVADRIGGFIDGRSELLGSTGPSQVTIG
jgi:hypothetical protein